MIEFTQFKLEIYKKDDELFGKKLLMCKYYIMHDENIIISTYRKTIDVIFQDHKI